jgi:hypothetical protein
MGRGQQLGAGGVLIVLLCGALWINWTSSLPYRVPVPLSLYVPAPDLLGGALDNFVSIV